MSKKIIQKLQQKIDTLPKGKERRKLKKKLLNLKIKQIMKKILFLLAMLTFTFGLNAQDLSTNEVDDFTGDVKKFTKYYNIGKSDVGLIKASIARLSNTYFLKVKSTTDLGCSGATGNYIIFKFTDGTILKLDDDVSDIECADGSPSFYIIKAEGVLASKTIQMIRFRQSKYYTDATTYGTYSFVQLLDAVK
tara:strand:+ start:2371 stop:2946 length:576 start_codon:yes stop_codon:yes gene_type:complete